MAFDLNIIVEWMKEIGPNTKGIIEHDFITGKDAELGNFPTPDELWMRLSRSEKIVEHPMEQDW